MAIPIEATSTSTDGNVELNIKLTLSQELLTGVDGVWGAIEIAANDARNLVISALTERYGPK